MAEAKGGDRKRGTPKASGFTIFELVVTLMILGMATLIVIPRLDLFRSNEIRGTLRQLTSLITHLAQESASTKEIYRLYFNLDSNEYWVAAVVGNENSELVTVKEKFIKRRKLPEGITFEDLVTRQKGRIVEGEVFMEFYAIGIEEAFTLHMKEKRDEREQHWTLQVNPLTGRVHVEDRYVDDDRP